MRQYMLPFLNRDVWLIVHVLKAPNNQNKERKPGLVFTHSLQTIYKKKIDAEKLNLYSAPGNNLIWSKVILLSFP